jgi:hypothetical protein
MSGETLRREGWRKRVRVEHTHDTAKVPRAGFEDREGHRTPCASVVGQWRRHRCRRKLIQTDMRADVK